MIRPSFNVVDIGRDLILLILGVLVLLPIILLVLLFAIPFLALEAIWSWVRKEPKPVIPPLEFDTSKNKDSKTIAEKLAKEAKHILSETDITHDAAGGSYKLTSGKLSKKFVEFTYHHDYVGIIVEDLNCYEWDNSSADSLDLFFWIAIGALRNGVTKARSRIGRTNFWVKCDEMGVWAVVQRDGSSYDSINFYKNPPNRIRRHIQI